MRGWWWALVDGLRVWRGRRRVRVAVERETARRVEALVPVQRQSADPVWWEFLPQQRDGER